jgi:hypothetical protein
MAFSFGRYDCVVTITIPGKEKAIFRLPELLRKINTAVHHGCGQVQARCRRPNSVIADRDRDAAVSDLGIALLGSGRRRPRWLVSQPAGGPPRRHRPACCAVGGYERGPPQMTIAQTRLLRRRLAMARTTLPAIGYRLSIRPRVRAEAAADAAGARRTSVIAKAAMRSPAREKAKATAPEAIRPGREDPNDGTTARKRRPPGHRP